MNFKEIGDYCKKKELDALGYTHLPSNSIVVMQMDGNAFHTYVKGLKKPFDESLTGAMLFAAGKLVESTHPLVAYVQSDEMTFIYKVDDAKNFPFAGRLNKLYSLYASKVSVAFNKYMEIHEPSKANKDAIFDCRVMIFEDGEHDKSMLPLVWRFMDCHKNAVSMIASAYIPHKQLLGKNSKERIDILKDVGVDYYSFPEFQRSGTFLKRIVVEKNLSDEELNKIPEQHRPTEPVMRSVVEKYTLPDLLRMENVYGYFVDGDEPTYSPDLLYLFK